MISVTLGNKESCQFAIKTLVAWYGAGYLSTEDEGSSERQTQVTISENVDAIRYMILDGE
jgi:hypothetical protein